MTSRVSDSSVSATLPTSRSELFKGVRFGQHEVVRVLGHGATASVFEARHVVLGKAVALKVLHEHLAADREVSARFVREGRVAAQIRHPNVVDVLDVGVEGGLPYLVMELLEGCDLAVWLRAKSRLTVEETLTIMLPVASAIASAHDAGALHRDLKPANVFLARDRRGELLPKIVDFGLSKQFGPTVSAPLTAADMVVGTLGYMAPEQTQGSAHADAKSDQYGLAAIMYECLTGRMPFTAKSIFGLVEAIRSHALPAPSHLEPTIPEGFDAVLLRAMSREPAERYPTVRAFGAALIRYADEATRGSWSRDFVERPSGHPAAGADTTISTKERIARRESEAHAVVTVAVGSGPNSVLSPASLRGSDAPSRRSSPSMSHAAATDIAPVQPTRTSSRAPAPPASGPASFNSQTPTETRVDLAASISAVRAADGLPCAPGLSPFHVKGMAYRGLLQFVSKRLPGGMDALLANLDDVRLHGFLKKQFLAASRYDILPMLPLHAAMARMVGVPIDVFARERAVSQARYDGETVYRRMVEGATLVDVATRLPRIGMQYYDFGTCDGWLVEPGHVVLRRTGVPAYVMRWYAPLQASYFEELVRVLGASFVDTRCLTPEAEGTRSGFEVVTYETELRWR